MLTIAQCWSCWSKYAQAEAYQRGRRHGTLNGLLIGIAVGLGAVLVFVWPW